MNLVTHILRGLSGLMTSGNREQEKAIHPKEKLHLPHNTLSLLYLEYHPIHSFHATRDDPAQIYPRA